MTIAELLIKIDGDDSGAQRALGRDLGGLIEARVDRDDHPVEQRERVVVEIECAIAQDVDLEAVQDGEARVALARGGEHTVERLERQAAREAVVLLQPAVITRRPRHDRAVFLREHDTGGNGLPELALRALHDIEADLRLVLAGLRRIGRPRLGLAGAEHAASAGREPAEVLIPRRAS